MKGNRRAAVALLKHRRQQMLSRVLLHVIEAARPFDTAVHRARFEALVGNVNDLFAFIEDVQNIGFIQFTDIVRLAPGSGIQSGAVEHNAPGLRRSVERRLAAHHLRGEFALKRIVVVEAACGHFVLCLNTDHEHFL